MRKTSRALIPTERNTAIESVKNVIENAVEKFLACLDAKERTKEAYRKSLRVFEIWISDKGIKNPQREHILAYKDFLQSKTIVGNDGNIKSLSSLTVSAYLTALRRFFMFLEGEKIYPNIAKDIKGLKRPRGFLKENLTKDEAKRLLDGIKMNAVNSLRDFAIINLMLRTGLRTIEIVRATIGDIGREGGETVLRVWGKGRDSKDEFVILTEASYKPILDYLQERKTTNTSEPLFASQSNRNTTAPLTTRSLRRIIEARLKAVGLKTSKVTAHSLRHTSATLALLNGADILQVKCMLRHSDINTTMNYAHNLDRLAKGAEKHIDF